MPAQPQLFHKSHPPEIHPARGSVRPASTLTTPAKTAPLWLQRISLFILVLFCIYLGVLVTVLPWWTRVWDQNMLILSHPRLAEILHLGAVRGIISGLGLLDIWIGISEAVHYRDHRA